MELSFGPYSFAIMILKIEEKKKVIWFIEPQA